MTGAENFRTPRYENGQHNKGIIHAGENSFGPIERALPDYLPPLYRSFFASVLAGSPNHPTEEAIHGAVALHYAEPPLTPLSNRQRMDLQSDMVDEYKQVFGGNTWKVLAGPTFYLPARESHPLRGRARLFEDRPGFYAGSGAEALIGVIPGVEPLTPDEKTDILTNPHFYESARITAENWSTSVVGNGTRKMIDDEEKFHDSYGFTEQGFRGLLSHVRTAQSKDVGDRLRGLDIGGSTGLGAYDAEQFDSHLDITNLFLDPELGIWPLRGGHILTQAENMPASFFEQYDVITSNMAFRYMRYPDVALSNALNALHVDGVLDISFLYDRSRLLNEDRDHELNRNLKNMFSAIDEAITNGYLKQLPSFTARKHDAIEDWREGQNWPYGRICLQKTKTFADLPGERFVVPEDPQQRENPVTV